MGHLILINEGRRNGYIQSTGDNIGSPVVTGPSPAHGFAAKRLFPVTMTVEDPFVADNAAIQFSRNKDETNTASTDLALEYAKTITPTFAISISSDYLRVKLEDDTVQYGFSNTSIGTKYLLQKNDAREMLFSVGADLELGGTGSARVGAESHSPLSPAFFFGHGFRVLPEPVKYLRPLAVTASLDPSFSIDRFRAQSVDTDFTLSYDFDYLHNFVKDAGLSAPLKHLVPIIEIPLLTCTTGECGRHTTGTCNPGVIWYDKHYQLALEAVIPVNRTSGSRTSVIA